MSCACQGKKKIIEVAMSCSLKGVRGKMDGAIWLLKVKGNYCNELLVGGGKRNNWCCNMLFEGERKKKIIVAVNCSLKEGRRMIMVAISCSMKDNWCNKLFAVGKKRQDSCCNNLHVLCLQERYLLPGNLFVEGKHIKVYFKKGVLSI